MKKNSQFIPLALLCIGAVFHGSSTIASAHDLTNGDVRRSPHILNLGPTGLSGWLNHAQVPRGTDNSTASRQILIEAVDAGSPADGVLQVGDVILGADGTGGVLDLFQSDAREAFGRAIGAAEARPPGQAQLRVIYWRPGMAPGQSAEATILLRSMGAYSPTAPYNCPKSEKILKEGLDFVMDPANGQDSGWRSFCALALLAANDPDDPDNAARMARAEADILSLVPDQQSITELLNDKVSPSLHVSWRFSNDLILLSEYYLQSGNADVLPAIHALGVGLANGQSHTGTWGHKFVLPGPDGSLNGRLNFGYGAMNTVGLYGYLGLLLARECGIEDTRIDRAIKRSREFFASFRGSGTIPYGEYGAFRKETDAPKSQTHETGGRNGMAAICFSLEEDRASEQRYFAQMTTAAASEHGCGHNGPYFNFVWSPLGAAMGGEEAAANLFSRISWRLDLARRWDGGFIYNSICFREGSPGGVPAFRPGDDFFMYAPALLTYALPLRQLVITGKSADSGRWLTTAEVAEAELADEYDATDRTIAELEADVGSFSYYAREKAIAELKTRGYDNIAMLSALANDPNGGVRRVGACVALGEIGGPGVAEVLFNLASDPDFVVRIWALKSFKKLPYSEKVPFTVDLLNLALDLARPFDPDGGEDPLHQDHAELKGILFSTDPANPRGLAMEATGTLQFRADLDRPLVISALKTFAEHPRGPTRDIPTLLNLLTEEEFRDFTPALISSVVPGPPADHPGSASPRGRALVRLSQAGYAEAVPLASQFYFQDINGEDQNANKITQPNLDLFDSLAPFGADVTLVNPNPHTVEFLEFVRDFDPLYSFRAVELLEAIASDSSPVSPPTLKSVTVTSTNPVTLSHPTRVASLSALGIDYAQGNSVYTWEKVRGAGQVTFHPNGTAAAINTTAVINGNPGSYVVRVTMSDQRGLTEVSDEIEIIVGQQGGGVPSNTPPVATVPSVPYEVGQATPFPITLDGTDAENNFLTYSITTPPTHGKLAGTPPYLTYTSEFGYEGQDSFTFQVMDSEGVTATGTIFLNVSEGAGVPLWIYEPFDYVPNGQTSVNLHGVSGPSEIGFSVDSWQAADNKSVVRDASLDYGPLDLNGNLIPGKGVPVSGGRFETLGGNTYGGTRRIDVSYLGDSPLMKPGATLWASAIVGCQPNTNIANTRLLFALANSGFPTGYTGGLSSRPDGSLGRGVGFTFMRFVGGSYGQARACMFLDKTEAPLPTNILYGDWQGNDYHNNLAGYDRYGLIVIRFTWSDDQLYPGEPGEPELKRPDIIEIFQPKRSLKFPSSPVSRLEVDVDQESFDTLTFAFGDRPVLDEIRFGPTYSSVIYGTRAAESDTSPPSVASIVEITPGPDGTSLSLLAATAYDPSEVQYNFKNLTLPDGNHDSGWQSAPSFTDTGLTPGQTYTYQVLVRDVSPAANQLESATRSGTTLLTQFLVDLTGMDPETAKDILAAYGFTVGADQFSTHPSIPAGQVIAQSLPGDANAPIGSTVVLTVSLGPPPDDSPPTPNPMTWAVPPAASSPTAVTMTATTASDESGVEYYFRNLSVVDGSHDSGWQASPTWEDTGLEPFTSYTYQVMARDTLAVPNVGAPSSPAVAVTEVLPGSVEPMLVKSHFYIVGSQSAPTSNRNFNVSVFDGKAMFSGQGNGIGGNNGNGPFEVVGHFGDGNVFDYRFFRSASNLVETYAQGSGAIISNFTTTDTSLSSSGEAFLWTGTDPGDLFDSTSDYGGVNRTILSSLSPSGSGSIDISALSRGTIYFIHGAYRSGSGISVVMRSSTGGAESRTLVVGNDDWANNGESYISSLHFLNAEDYDIIEYTYSGGSSFMGVVVANAVLNPTLYADDFNRPANSSVLGQTSIGGLDWQTAAYDVTTKPASLYGISGNGEFHIDGAGGKHDPGVAWVNHDLDSSLSYKASFSLSFPGSTNAAASFLIFPRFKGDAIPGNQAFLLRTDGQNPASFRVFDYQGAPLSGSSDKFINTSGLLDLTSSGPLPVSSSGQVIVYQARVVVSDDRAYLFLNDGLIGSIAVSGAGDATPDFLGLGYAPCSNTGRSLIVSIDDLEVSTTSENVAPIWVGDPVQMPAGSEGAAYSGTLAGMVSDANNDSLIFTKVSGSAWLTVSAGGGLSGTPGPTNVGANAFTVSVTDGVSAPVITTVNISVEATTTLVPDVVGLPEATATANLTAANLTIGSVTGEYSNTVAADEVISQALVAGSRVPLQTAVHLVVSQGIDPSPKLFQTTITAVRSDSWTTVDTQKVYRSPVIIATPIYPNNTVAPVVTRIRNVTSSGFELKIDRADNLTAAVTRDVSVIVIDEGVYTVAEHGVKMEAVRFTSTVTARKGSWVAEAYHGQLANTYSNPVVVGQVMSANDPRWSVFWSMGSSTVNPVSATQLNIGKHVAEDPVTTRANETLGFVVIEAGSGTIEGMPYRANLGPATIGGTGNSTTPDSYTLNPSLANPSAAAVSISGMKGTDGGWSVLGGASPLSPTEVKMWIDEDQMADSERGHADEHVAYIVIGGQAQ